MRNKPIKGNGCYSTGAVLAALALAVLPGCVSSRSDARHHSVRRFATGDTTPTLASVERAFLDLGLTIARRDPTGGTVQSTPFRAGTPLDRRTSAARPGLYDRLQRVASVRIDRDRQSGQVSVYCRVEVQEQSTQALRMLSQDQRPSDVPNQTPIQREAATTPEQNTVWRPIRRDFAAERVILEMLLPTPSG